MTRGEAGPTLLFVTLAEKIRMLRESKGLTQYALAKAAGMNQSQLAAIEKGRNQNPGVYTVHRIALALGVSLGEMVSDQTVQTVVIHPTRLQDVTELARKEGITAAEAAGRLAEQEGIPLLAETDQNGPRVTVTTLPEHDPLAGTRSEAEKIARGVVMVMAAAERLKGTVLSDEEIEERIRSMAESLEQLAASVPAPKP